MKEPIDKLKAGGKMAAHSKTANGAAKVTVCCLLLFFLLLSIGFSPKKNLEEDMPANIKPDWYSGTIVAFNSDSMTVTVTVKEKNNEAYVFSLERLEQSRVKRAFATMKQGDFIYASCLSKLVEKDDGSNIVVSFKIKDAEKKESQ